jgi:meiotically up-regulated gene 157 (Mug157) protein
MLLERQDKKTGLFPTDETPADDPVHLPYHLSSHILLWRTLKKLNYDNLADSIQAAVFRYFSAEYEGSTLFAYLTDGSGQYHFYHDANDLPLAFAPLWGFCTADNPIWTATMNFAFSETNKGGFYGTADDEFRGLGSVHTPAVWPLGDVQELVFARLTGDVYRQQKVIQKLAKVAQWDGALPEAYDPKTGNVVSRHWFAWPNAALACVEFGVFQQ